MRLKEKTLVIIAGPNGSGKSTFRFLETSLHGLPFVKADDIAKKYGTVGQVESLKAQQEAQEQIAGYLSRGESFCFETVFSHESKIQLIKNAKELGFIVILYVVNTGISDLNIIRVKERVKGGGHNVPVDKILSRISRTLANLKVALPAVDGFFIINSSGIDSVRFKIEVIKEIDEEMQFLDAPPPWVSELVSLVTSGQSANQSTVATHLKLVQPSRDICSQCGASLRGKKRKKYGICSRCSPRY
jgi:predicted ABC-type ATPase